MSNEEYQPIVMSAYNQLALGNLPAELPAVETWVANQHGLTVGGKATEAAFDAMRRFGISVEKIQATAGV